MKGSENEDTYEKRYVYRSLLIVHRYRYRLKFSML